MENKRNNSFIKTKTKNINSTEINVIIHYAYSKDEKHYKLNVSIKENCISLQELLNELSKENVNLTKTSISFYDIELGSFIFGGKYPLNNDWKIPLSSRDKSPSIMIRIRKIINEPNLMRMDLNEEIHGDEDETNQNVIGIKAESKRSKERKIGYIIEKVFLWRKLYYGFIDQNGEKIKMTLEEAADQVGISKKSLDDYLIQLRIGRQFGFEFGEHKNDKVGVLRAFVKKYSNKAIDNN
jgi:hypothetical protein